MLLKLLIPLAVATSINISSASSIGGSISLDAYPTSDSEKISFYCISETKKGICKYISILSEKNGNTFKYTHHFEMSQSEERINKILDKREARSLNLKQSNYYYPISGAYNRSGNFDSAKGNIDALGKITVMLGALLADTVIFIPTYIYSQGEKAVKAISSSEREAFDFMLDSANKGEVLEVSETDLSTIKRLME